MWRLVLALLNIYELIIFVRVIMSWVRPDPYHPFVQWIHKLTDPVLEPIRKRLPSNSMGIDFSPLIVLVGMEFIRRALFGF